MITLKNESTRHLTCCGEGVYRVGMGAGGQWAEGEGVADGAHGFRVVKISSGFRSCENFWEVCHNNAYPEIVVFFITARKNVYFILSHSNGQIVFYYYYVTNNDICIFKCQVTIP
jgi:hypothetical protein